MRKQRVWLVLTLLLVAASGCTRVSVVYHFADFFIEQTASDYLSLDDAQMASWRPALAEALARHRRDELPYLATFFDDFERGTRERLDASTLECQLNAFEEIYRRHLRLAVQLAAPLLASLRPDQVRTLEQRFQWDAREDAPTQSDERAERRAAKRAERWSEAAEWWIGTLSEGQREMVREATASIPDTGADWAAYRAARQEGLIRLLDERAGEERIRAYLTDWMVDHRELPAGLRQAWPAIRGQVAGLLLSLDASLSDAQRAWLRDRLSELRDDFMELQDRPARAETRCAA